MNLIPHFIYERFAQQQLSGRFLAATLFADISGFTPLTEMLLRHGKEGAEALSEVVQQTFAPLVAEVYACGGFISGFAGDAFTAFFPYAAAATADTAPSMLGILSRADMAADDLLLEDGPSANGAPPPEPVEGHSSAAQRALQVASFVQQFFAGHPHWMRPQLLRRRATARIPCGSGSGWPWARLNGAS